MDGIAIVSTPGARLLATSGYEARYGRVWGDHGAGAVFPGLFGAQWRGLRPTGVLVCVPETGILEGSTGIPGRVDTGFGKTALERQNGC